MMKVKIQKRYSCCFPLLLALASVSRALHDDYKYVYSSPKSGNTCVQLTHISLSISTDKLFAWTMTLYSGFMWTGCDIACADAGVTVYFSTS